MRSSAYQDFRGTKPRRRSPVQDEQFVLVARSRAAPRLGPARGRRRHAQRRRLHQQCLDKDNALKIDGPCPNNVPDPAAAIPKLASARAKAVAKIADKCTFPGDLTANGYPLDCAYEAIATGKEYFG